MLHLFRLCISHTARKAKKTLQQKHPRPLLSEVFPPECTTCFFMFLPFNCSFLSRNKKIYIFLQIYTHTHTWNSSCKKKKKKIPSSTDRNLHHTSLIINLDRCSGKNHQPTFYLFPDVMTTWLLTLLHNCIRSKVQDTAGKFNTVLRIQSPSAAQTVTASLSTLGLLNLQGKVYKLFLVLKCWLFFHL